MSEIRPDNYNWKFDFPYSLPAIGVEEDEPFDTFRPLRPGEVWTQTPSTHSHWIGNVMVINPRVITTGEYVANPALLWSTTGAGTPQAYPGSAPIVYWRPTPGHQVPGGHGFGVADYMAGRETSRKEIEYWKAAYTKLHDEFMLHCTTAVIIKPADDFPKYAQKARVYGALACAYRKALEKLAHEGSFGAAEVLEKGVSQDELRQFEELMKRWGV